MRYIRHLGDPLRFVLILLLPAYSSPGLAAGTNYHQLIEVRNGPRISVSVLNESVRRMPPGFFGFTLESKIFERDAHASKQNTIRPDLLRHYSALADSTYRFPGGLMANHFNWEWSVGDLASRKPQKLAEWAESSPAIFGTQEYLSFLATVKGRFWYTLNLNGWSTTGMNAELPSPIVAESNKRLAMYVRDRAPSGSVRYYHLGNELDRSDYEWPTTKYISRSLDSIRAVSSVDPNARFVAFLRDFDYEYRSQPGKSHYRTFMREVFDALPMVNDFSLQYYYDHPTSGKPRSDIAYRLRMFSEAIDTATKLRGGQPPRVWITEHGRARHPRIKGDKANTFTAGLGSAIAAADFWIAVTQMPAIEGAFLYSVGQWSIFQSVGDSAYPLPMYWTVRILRSLDLPIVLATQTTSTNHGQYAGGYDVRAVALTDESRSSFGLWIVNRATRDLTASVNISSLAGKRLLVRHNYLAGQPGVDADQNQQPPRVFLNQPAHMVDVGKDGSIMLDLPASSISSFELVIASSP